MGNIIIETLFDIKIWFRQSKWMFCKFIESYNKITNECVKSKKFVL
mgnify:CR=1 FL=1